MQKTLSRSISSSLSCLFGAALMLGGLSSSAALAQTAAPSEPAAGVAASVGGPASLGQMRLSLDVVPAPLGKFKTKFGDSDVSSDAAMAFGLRVAFDYSINEYIFVGFGPQALFNVKGKDFDGDAAKQFDLSARLGGHAPIGDNLHLYGFLSPGYSILSPPKGDAAKGFSLGVAVGALVSFPGSNFFLNGELGYHMTFLSVDGVDFKTNYPLIALGGGVKF